MKSSTSIQGYQNYLNVFFQNNETVTPSSQTNKQQPSGSKTAQGFTQITTQLQKASSTTVLNP